MTAYLGDYCSLFAEIDITNDLFDFNVIAPNGENFACPVSPLTLTTQANTGIISEWQWSNGATAASTDVTTPDIHHVTVTSTNGCQYSASFETEVCPTLISFSGTEAAVPAGESVEICLELVNPNDQPASVDVNFVNTQNPHFDSIPAVRTINFAAGETYQCFNMTPRKVDAADDFTTYQLELSNASGGQAASLREPKRLILTVENAVKCVAFQDSIPVNCAISDTTTIDSNVPLITTLKENDSFFAGDFAVEVTQATGNSVFNGEGIIRVPYFEQVQISVLLKNVEINELCQMVSGEVVVEGAGAKLLSDEILDAINDLLETLDEIDDALEVIQEVLDVLTEVINASEEVNNVLSQDWNISQGSGPIQNEYPDLPDSVLTQIDNALLCFETNPPGQCAEELGEAIDALITAINELFKADYAIQFKAYEEQHYGFDKEQYSVMSDDYNRLTIAGSDYKVA